MNHFTIEHTQLPLDVLNRITNMITGILAEAGIWASHCNPGGLVSYDTRFWSFTIQKPETPLISQVASQIEGAFVGDIRLESIQRFHGDLLCTLSVKVKDAAEALL